MFYTNFFRGDHVQCVSNPRYQLIHTSLPFGDVHELVLLKTATHTFTIFHVRIRVESNHVHRTTPKIMTELHHSLVLIRVVPASSVLVLIDLYNYAMCARVNVSIGFAPGTSTFNH